MNFTFNRTLLPVGLFVTGILIGSVFSPLTIVQAQPAERVFELRTYTAPEGKLGELEARFRDHTRRFFDKHGMTPIGFWIPQDAPQSSNTFVYILAHPSREAARKNWAAILSDPEWAKVAAATEANGKLVDKVESIYLQPTDFSPIK